MAADVEGWAQYSMEKLVASNPDVIITSAHAGDVKKLRELPGYQELKAVRNDRVYVISNDDPISRASGRIVLGLQEIARGLHPEAFK